MISDCGDGQGFTEAELQPLLKLLQEARDRGDLPLVVPEYLPDPLMELVIAEMERQDKIAYAKKVLGD